MGRIGQCVSGALENIHIPWFNDSILENLPQGSNPSYGGKLYVQRSLLKYYLW